MSNSTHKVLGMQASLTWVMLTAPRTSSYIGACAWYGLWVSQGPLHMLPHTHPTWRTHGGSWLLPQDKGCPQRNGPKSPPAPKQLGKIRVDADHPLPLHASGGLRRTLQPVDTFSFRNTKSWTQVHHGRLRPTSSMMRSRAVCPDAGHRRQGGQRAQGNCRCSRPGLPCSKQTPVETERSRRAQGSQGPALLPVIFFPQVEKKSQREFWHEGEGAGLGFHP